MEVQEDLILRFFFVKLKINEDLKVSIQNKKIL